MGYRRGPRRRLSHAGPRKAYRRHHAGRQALGTGRCHLAIATDLLAGARGARSGTAMALALAVQAQAKDVVVHAGRLIDGVSGARAAGQGLDPGPQRPDRLASRPGFTTPTGAASDRPVETPRCCPGMIDCHVHITASYHKGDPIRNAPSPAPTSTMRSTQ